MNQQPIYFILLALASFLIVSCSSNRKMMYVQDKSLEKPQDDIQDKVFQRVYDPYQLSPGDILSIQVGRIVSGEYDPSNIGIAERGMQNRQHPYLDGITVDDSGMVILPVLGMVKVGELTLKEAEKKIIEVANQYYSSPTVRIFLLNFNVTLLGDVMKPGIYPVYKHEINVLEAIAMAGDLDEYADREEVRILRNIGDKTYVLNIDLTDQKLLLSDRFMLKPNDIIMVKSLKRKKFAGKVVAWTLSGISTVAVIVSLVLRFK